MSESNTSATSSGATEAASDRAVLPHHSWLQRLYTGTGGFEVVGRRKFYYWLTGAIVALSLLSILVRGFSLGIEFEAAPASSSRPRRV